MTGRLPRRAFLATAGLTSTIGIGVLASQGDHDDHNDGGHEYDLDIPETGEREIVDINERGNEITLKVVPARHALHPEHTVGGPVELPMVWAFQADDGTPSVPGPVLRVEEGTEFDVTLENLDSSGHSHTFHLHALSRAWKDDGAPHTTGIKVDNGEARTYRYTADVTGTHFYHCHVNTPLHIDMGMYGMLRVDPKGSRTGRSDRPSGRATDDSSVASSAGATDYKGLDREYFMSFREWDTRVSDFHAGMLADMNMDMEDGDHGGHGDHGDGYKLSTRDPDAFTINGKSAPTTFDEEDGSLVFVEEGDAVRVHWMNAGFVDHTMHTHTHRFRIVEKDGTPIPKSQQHEMDTLNMGPGERYTVEFEADSDPGIYPLHCHRADHVRNGDTHMGGMLTAIVYESVMDTEEYENLATPGGHDGGHGDHGGEHEEDEHGGHDDGDGHDGSDHDDGHDGGH